MLSVWISLIYSFLVAGNKIQLAKCFSESEEKKPQYLNCTSLALFATSAISNSLPPVPLEAAQKISGLQMCGEKTWLLFR